MTQFDAKSARKAACGRKPRGPSVETLPAESAQAVRRMVKDAMRFGGVTRQQLYAKLPGMRPSAIDRALAPSRPMGKLDAIAILVAVNELALAAKKG